MSLLKTLYIKTTLEQYKEDYNNMDSYSLIDSCFKNAAQSIAKFGYDVSYMKYVIDTTAHHSNGNVVNKKDQIWSASWGENHIIYVNPNYKEVMNYFNVDLSPEHWFTFIISYQLAKELYKNQWKEKDKAEIYNKANNDKSFHSLYLDSLNGSSGSVINEETCCEYFATMVCRMNGFK